ncbi:Retrovirus-related Pol polyprotein from transposon [Dictyocoela roeselum]|nr:Retrovirus-related Pol polyprotein from transposon [Dictyocoela roeselum]
MNILTDGEVTKRVNRWKLLMEEYNYKLVRIEGEKNIYADTISRIYSPLNKQLPSSSERNKIYSLLPSRKGKRQITPAFLYLIHQKLIHPGEKAMNILIKENFYLPNATKLIKEVVKNCLECQRNKQFLRYRNIVGGHIIASEPLEFVSSDILGPIKREHFKTTRHDKYF